LILAYESGEVHRGRDILGRLLQAPTMVSPWREMTRALKKKEAKLNSGSDRWMEVWDAIVQAKHRSRQAILGSQRGPATRKDEADYFAGVASLCAELARKIEGRPLDLLVYELLPDEVIRALVVGDFRNLDSRQRNKVARRLLPAWPSAAEVIRELGARASADAQIAATATRLIERNTENAPERIFVVDLGHRFKLILDAKPIVTTANLTDVVFDRTIPLEHHLVRSWLRGG